MMTETVDLTRKTIQPDRIAELALDDEALLQGLLAGISPETRKAPLRENSSQALMYMAETWPEMLLPHWAYFVGLLKSDNGFSKYAAIYILTSLARISDQRLFERTFNLYYDLLDDESVMVAAHAARNSGRLAKAHPTLQAKITQRLLAIGKTHFDASRKDLIKGYVIEALDEYMDVAQQKAKILAFVKQQVDCTSPKTRKLAKAFLQKWEANGGSQKSA